MTQLKQLFCTDLSLVTMFQQTASSQISFYDAEEFLEAENLPATDNLLETDDLLMTDDLNIPDEFDDEEFKGFSESDAESSHDDD